MLNEVAAPTSISENVNSSLTVNATSHPIPMVPNRPVFADDTVISKENISFKQIFADDTVLPNLVSLKYSSFDTSFPDKQERNFAVIHPRVLIGTKFALMLVAISGFIPLAYLCAVSFWKVRRLEKNKENADAAYRSLN
jgi:hypothetical protein